MNQGIEANLEELGDMAGERREVTVNEIKAQSENALVTGPFGSS